MKSILGSQINITTSARHLTHANELYGFSSGMISWDHAREISRSFLYPLTYWSKLCECPIHPVLFLPLLNKISRHSHQSSFINSSKIIFQIAWNFLYMANQTWKSSGSHHHWGYLCQSIVKTNCFCLSGSYDSWKNAYSYRDNLVRASFLQSVMIFVLNIAQILRFFWSRWKQKYMQALWHLKEVWGKSLRRKEGISSWFSSANKIAILNKIPEKLSSDIFAQCCINSENAQFFGRMCSLW